MLPATTKEQRGPMYRDLERLISPGFMTTTVRVGGIPLGIRSLGPNDLDLLRSVAQESGEEWTSWLIAASVWMIDGHYLLGDYPAPMRSMFDWVKRSNRGTIRALFSVVASFFARYRKANRLLESYLYEDSSRRRWASARTLNTYLMEGGFPGANRIGMNPYQEVWIDWNQREDTRQNDEYSWELTKVLVSVQSNKYAKKLDSRDKARLDREKERRSSVQDQAYYLWNGTLDEKGNRLDEQDSRKVFQPRTNEELAEEMRRWVAGEKDFHDQVIDDYMNRVKSEYERREAEREQMLREAAERRARQEQEQGFSAPPLVALTPEQVANLVQTGRPAGARFIHEADPVSRLYNRYVRDLPDPGKLRVVGNRVVPYTESSTEGKEPKPSLDDLIANRKPSFDG